MQCIRKFVFEQLGEECQDFNSLDRNYIAEIAKFAYYIGFSDGHKRASDKISDRSGKRIRY